MEWIIAIVAVNLIVTVTLFFLGQKKNFTQLETFLKDQSRSQQDLLDAKIQGHLQGHAQSLVEKVSQMTTEVVEKLGKNSAFQQKELFEFKGNLQKELQERFEGLNKTVEGRLEKISQKVQADLGQGLEKTHQSFSELLKRLAKIDEAQRKIEDLSSNVVSLQDILTDKKSRGIFGEVQLNHLLENVFGDRKGKTYQTQFMLSNKTIVDAALFLPEPLGTLAVDSKFPLENFKRMHDPELAQSMRDQHRKEFVKNVKKHIDDIAGKYIIQGETSDQAIMFLPAEAIFAELHAYHEEVIHYANSKRIWIASPTTFMATLTTVQSVLVNIERNKYMEVIHLEINKLGKEFERYQTRWDDLAKHINTVQKDVDKIHTTSNKIADRFKRIVDVEVSESKMVELASESQLFIQEESREG